MTNAEYRRLWRLKNNRLRSQHKLKCLNLGVSVKPETGVYFIQGEKTRLIKIGETSNTPIHRLKQLQIGSPDKLCLLLYLPKANEKMLHYTFAEDRVHGEWFNPSTKLLTFIKENQ